MTRLHGLLAVLLLAALCAAPAHAADTTPAQADAAKAAPADQAPGQSAGKDAAAKKPAPKISPEFRTDILTFMHMTGSDRVGRMMGAEMANRLLGLFYQRNPNLAPEAVKVIQEELMATIEDECKDDAPLMNLLVPVYATHFTQEDIQGLIAFYKTPLGAKALKVMPKVLGDAMEAGQQYAPTMAKTMYARLEKRLEAEGIETEPAPKDGAKADADKTGGKEAAPSDSKAAPEEPNKDADAKK